MACGTCRQEAENVYNSAYSEAIADPAFENRPFMKIFDPSLED